MTGSTVWFRADQLAVAGNSAAWTDQSAPAVGNSTFNSIDVAVVHNFNNALVTNNNNDIVSFDRPQASIQSMTGFVVFATTGAATSITSHWRGEHAILSADQNGGTEDFGFTMGSGRLHFYSDATGGAVRVAESANTYNDGNATIGCFTRDHLTPFSVNIFANGTADGSGNANGDNLNDNGTWAMSRHPGSPAGTGRLDGNFMEVIWFPSVLSAANRQAVETYLGIKYGITLGHNYVDASAAVLYSIAGHANEVIGIGRADGSALNQKQSKTATTKDLNTNMALYLGGGYAGTFPASNAANANSFSLNNQYLITGHDGGVATQTGTYLGAANTRIARTYKITDVGGVGTVTLRFDNTTFTGLGTGRQYFLGVSNDVNFDNSDTWVAMTEQGTSGDFYVEYDFSDNTSQFFTIREGGNFGPGGVSAGVEGWWRADMGTSGASLTTWNDQSPWGRTLTRTSGTVDVLDGLLNFNPHLKLSALAQDFGTAGTINGRTLVVVARNTGTSATDAGLAGLDGGPGFRFNAANQIKDGTNAGNDWTDGATGILNVNAAAVADAGFSPALSEWKILVGSRAAIANNEFWVGGFDDPANDPNPANTDFAEAIVFRNDVNTGITKQQIESYLAIKYGITLAPATYVNSGGGTIYSDVTYANNIAGIGRDDRSVLDQKQSSSVNADSVITIGLNGVFAATNALNTATFPADQSFFVVGDNGADDCWSNVEINISGFTSQYWRTIREWKMTTTGTIPAVSIRVDSLAGTWVLPTLPTGATNYSMLLDADGNFSAGSVVVAMTRVPGQSTYQANLSAADLATYSYFTIGVNLPDNFRVDSLCNVDDFIFYGSNLEVPNSCIRLASLSNTFNISQGASITATTYQVIQDNPGACLDIAQWNNLTIPSGSYVVTSFTGGCGVTPAELVSQDTIVVAAAVAAGTLEVNGSTEAFLCLGDPNATLSGFGGVLSAVSPPGSGPFSSLVDTTGFDSTGFATLFVHSGNLGLHKVYLAANGCSVADTVNVYIGTPSPSTVTYAVSSACISDTTPLLPTVGPVATPGSFSSTAGLRIDPQTGSVRADSSVAGTYFVTFNPSDSTCRTNSVATVTVQALDVGVFTYPTPYCLNDTNPVPFVTVPFPGSYAITTGLAIDSVSGEVLLDTAAASGTYTVSFLPSGTCRDTTFFDILLQDAPSVSFTLADTACDPDQFVDAANLSPAASANQYVWGSPVAGAVVFSGPGRIDLTASAPGGPHPVSASYTDPATGCTSTAVREITVLDVLPLTVTYPSLSFCQGASDAVPVITSGPPGGYFYSTDPGLVFRDSLTGVLDLTASDSGVFQVMYMPPYPSCTVGVQAAGITVGHTPVADFTAPATVCWSDTFIQLTMTEPGLAELSIFWGTFPVPSVDTMYDPLTQQLFFSVGNGFLFEDRTYEMVLVASDGLCSDTARDYFLLLGEEDATFDYIEESYCQSESDPVPFIHGDGGGTFQALGAAVLDSVTGLVDLDSSGTGTYIVQYTTSGPCPDVAVDTFSVLPGYKSYFRYRLNDVCTRRDTISVLTNYAPANAPQNFFQVSGSPPLTINPTTGEITGMSTLSLTGTEVYVIGHATGGPGTCLDTTKIEITLTSPDLLFNIEYGVAGVVDTFCGSGTVVPSLSGDLTGASLTNPAGLIYSNQGTLGEVALQYTAHDQAYTVLLTNQSVCRDTSSDRFYVRAMDDARFSYGTTEACSGEGTLFPDTVHFTPGLFYYIPSFSGAVLALDPVTGVIDMSASTKNSSYRVYYRTLGACRDTSFVLLDINASPFISGIEPTPGGLSYCDSSEVSMVCQGQGDVRWFVNGTLFTTQRTFRSDELVDGDTVRAVLSDPASGCSDTMEVTVQILPRPLAEIADLDTVLTADGPFTLDLRAFQDHTTVFWSLETSNVEVGLTSGGGGDTLFVGDLLTVENTASIINPYDPGYIVVSLIPQTFGCVGYRTTDTIRVTPGGMPVFIPEVITPNGDDKNDDWEILFSPAVDPAAHTIEVYNRAGAKVHVVTSLTERWTGGTNPDGVYWWILRDATGAPVQQGGLTIRRR